MNQIGLKALQNFADQRNVSQECRIEAKVFLQRKGEKATRQLKRPDVAFFQNGLCPVARSNAEKRQIAPPRESLKVAAGMRNPVHLVKRVGKVSHARHRCIHRLNQNPDQGRIISGDGIVPLLTPLTTRTPLSPVVLAEGQP